MSCCPLPAMSWRSTRVIRSWSVEVPAVADAWPHTAPLRAGDQRGARVRAEPPPLRQRDAGSKGLTGIWQREAPPGARVRVAAGLISCPLGGWQESGL
jgi:hypothetical protein